MKECAPDAQEIISYGIAAYRNRLIPAVINPTKKDITFAFSRGVEFGDSCDLLQEVGKVSKHVKLKTVADANLDALRYYIVQTLELDQKSAY